MSENSKVCLIKEQTIDDLVTGLAFQFQTMSEGRSRLRINGLRSGGREFIFNERGQKDASGVAVGGFCDGSQENDCLV